MATATTATTGGASGAQGKAQAPPSAPFRVGVQRTLSTDGYTNSTALTTSTTDLPIYEPSPNAFLRGLWILSQATGVNSTATVALAADAPFNAYSTVTFSDSNQKPIIGPFDGYTLMAVNKFGAYQNLGDPRASAIYSTTVGTATTAGSWTYVLYVPLEVVSRDGLGALANKSTSQPFTLSLTLNTTASVFGTAPSTSCTVKTRIIEDGWWQPKAATANGTPLTQSPPESGTTQYWTRGSYTALSGSVQQQISQGLGYPVRNHMFITYDTSGTTRATGQTDFPDPIQFIYKGTSIWNIPKTFWDDQMSRSYDYPVAAFDSANGLENGVFVLNYNQDFGLEPGDELRNGYLVTQQGDQFQLVGSYAGSCTTYCVANYVAPANGNPDSLRAGA